MSLGSSPLSKAGLPPVITGCLLNNKPPDSGERLAHTQGPRQCGAQSPFCPRAAQPHTPADPGGAKGVTHLCNPCDLHTLPGYNCRRPGQQTSRGGGGTCSSAPIPLASLSFCIPPSLLLGFPWASPVAQLVKNPPVMWETQVQYLRWEDPLEKGKTTLSRTLAWRIPWTV